MLLAIKFSGAENCDNFGRGHSGKLMSAIRPAVDAIEAFFFLARMAFILSSEQHNIDIFIRGGSQKNYSLGSSPKLCPYCLQKRLPKYTSS